MALKMFERRLPAVATAHRRMSMTGVMEPWAGEERSAGEGGRLHKNSSKGDFECRRLWGGGGEGVVWRGRGIIHEGRGETIQLDGEGGLANGLCTQIALCSIRHGIMHGVLILKENLINMFKL